MADEQPDLECGPDGDVCVIDTKKLIEERAKQGAKGSSSENSVMFLITRGTYGRFDDAYGAILVANAALAKQQAATFMLIGNGIYLAMKDQEPSDIFLPNNLPEISDFIELGGRILVHQGSIEKRGVSRDELLEDIEIIEDNRIVTEIEKHKVSLTF
jgi:sulfur relay (sulfurtransferase) DsrF/TusC family protein